MTGPEGAPAVPARPDEQAVAEALAEMRQHPQWVEKLGDVSKVIVRAALAAGPDDLRGALQEIVDTHDRSCDCERLLAQIAVDALAGARPAQFREAELWVVVERRPHGTSLACERLYTSRADAEKAWEIRQPPKDGRDLVAVALAGGRPGEAVNISVDDLRPDTGGRDLTAQDVASAWNDWVDHDTGSEWSSRVADYLNRIARGDRPSRAVCICPQGQGVVDPECPVHTGPDRSRWSEPTGPAAGPRAGDTAPGDRPLEDYRTWRQYDVASAEEVATLRVELDRLRSEAAALRAAGDKLAAAADQVTDGVLSWPHVEGSLIRAREVWRSAAGSPATEDGGEQT